MRVLSFCAFLPLLACSAELGSGEPAAGGEQAQTTGDESAGVYTAYDGNWDEGHIHQMHLREDHTFGFAVRGLFGCTRYSGYSCPSTWSDGYTGWTHVVGTWSAKPGGVELQPKDDEPGRRPSDPVLLTLTKRGDKVEVRGTMARHAISADMDVEALYKVPRSLERADLAGTWTVTTEPDEEGDYPSITGTTHYARGHVFTFVVDPAKWTWDEKREDDRNRKPDGLLFVAGAADRSGEGVLILEYLEGGQVENTARVKSFGGGKMTVDVGEGRLLDLERR
jgi:hypothetical protein